VRPGTLIRWAALRPLLAREVRAGASVLDVGGFDGTLAAFINSHCRNVSVNVLDVDLEGLAIARAAGLNTVAGEAENLPVASGTIDVVLCLDIIEHLEDEAQLLVEIFRVMKKGGRLILSTPKENGIVFPFMNQTDIERINYQWGHKRLGYSFREIEVLVGHQGFVVERTSAYFNIVTRILYRFSLLTKQPLPFTSWLFSKLVFLEPYLRWGAQEHTIVFRKP